MERIEFIEGEPYCRFDGILMDDAGSISVYGYDYEIDIIDDKTICMEGTIYTDKKFNELIKTLGKVTGKVEKYDEITSSGRGFASYCALKDLENTVVISLHAIEYIEKVKPFCEFEKDYPNFNMDRYTELMSCLDDYYNKMLKND